MCSWKRFQRVRFRWGKKQRIKFRLIEILGKLHILAAPWGFDLTTRDSYFTILAEIFTSHILAETHIYFTNQTE